MPETAARTRNSWILVARAGIIAAATLTGCFLGTGPDLLAFERISSLPAIPPILSTSQTSIVLESVFATPCEPYGASANISSSARVLTLRVRGKASGPCPADVIGSFFYRATIGPLARGTYVVRAVYSYADANWPTETSNLGTITIP